MSGVLLFLAGAMVGAAVAWLIAVRFAVPPRTAVAPPFPDDLFGSDTATQLASGMDAESAFEPLAYVMMERCAARVALPCALVMREKPGGSAHIAAVAGGLDNRLLGVDVPLDSPAGRAITDGLPVVGSPDEKVLNIDRRDRRQYGKGGISVPLAQGGHVYGAVVAFGEPPAGTQDALDGLAQELRRFVPLIIPAYAAAVSAKRAETDDLTGLGNRRAFNALLSRNNVGERAALVIFDVDHFKDVNDSLGHPAGDAALRHLARLVKDTLRPRDSAARIGGEEFAVWLPGADLKTGEEVAERLRARIEATPFRFAGTERVMTISCGVAAYPTPTRAVENLLVTADTALYAAKRAGRNQVVASRAASA